jgi:hypothetical protein
MAKWLQLKGKERIAFFKDFKMTETEVASLI